ncbi:DegV family protein [Bacillus kwashiorkori]|uniref:DegV family protein n=1 Tax=Bacillus kwashiorkori TaxID=1522318 RepID=UPI0007849B11|nr:DegV family protein [Bacillus kwashiorkori]
MSNIKITCDRTADLSKDLIETYNIDTIPFYINLDGKSYKDGIDIQPAEIFAYVERTEKLPKTAAVPVGDYITFFSKFRDTYDAIIHINLGEKFSSSYQNACIAAKEFSNVYIINSDNLSTGTGHLVIEACKMVNSGMKTEMIIKQVENLIPKVEASFVIDTLDYLKMGGRCSALTAFSANLLNIKPNIEVLNGKMEVGKKYRGKIDKSIYKYVTDRLKGRKDIITDRIFVTHSGCSEELISEVKQLIQQYQNFDEIIETTASCTISCHCGPNTLGILFKTE